LNLISEYGLANNVQYLGPKYGKEKNNILLSSDIFVFPTYYAGECFPLSILEAMKFSLPIITTTEGAIEDIVDNGVSGFFVPQKDVLALADKMVQLIINPALRQQMGAAGRVKYEKEFTLNTFETRLKEILTEIINTQK
jgi:glycosyltransferase involved in cell wall biosynthesis